MAHLFVTIKNKKFKMMPSNEKLYQFYILPVQKLRKPLLWPNIQINSFKKNFKRQGSVLLSNI